MGLRVVIRGGGDLASGVALRLVRVGCQVILLELAMPVTVRRGAAFAQAVYAGHVMVEEVAGDHAPRLDDVEPILKKGHVAVLIDPDLSSLDKLSPDVMVDGRMLKGEPLEIPHLTPLDIGLGPGYIVGINCHAVVETKRGPNLGRVYWNGAAEQDTGLPERVGNYQEERVLRAPVSGVLSALAAIGDQINKGDAVAAVDGQMVLAPFPGILRGLLMDGLAVSVNMKIGDIDPRNNLDLCYRVSDKALAIGGGVLEAVLSIKHLRRKLGDS